VVPIHGLRLVSVLSSSKRGRNVVDVCKAILEGAIVVRGIDLNATGLRRILIDPNEAAAKPPTPPVDDASGDSTMSLKKAARSFRITYDLLLHWSRCGLFETFPPGPRGRGVQTTAKTMRGFLANYVWGVALNAEIGVGKASYRLVEAGVAPVATGHPHDRVPPLFRRSEIDALNRTGFREELERRERRLNEAGKTTGPRSGTATTLSFAAAVGDHAMKALGRDFPNRCNVFSDAHGNEVIRVLSARSNWIRPNGTKRLITKMTPAYVKQLDAAAHAWLVVALMNEPIYLLIPWQRIAYRFAHLVSGESTALQVTIQPDGSVDEEFAEFARPVPSGIS